MTTNIIKTSYTPKYNINEIKVGEPTLEQALQFKALVVMAYACMEIAQDLQGTAFDCKKLKFGFKKLIEGIEDKQFKLWFDSILETDADLFEAGLKKAKGLFQLMANHLDFHSMQLLHTSACLILEDRNLFMEKLGMKNEESTDLSFIKKRDKVRGMITELTPERYGVLQTVYAVLLKDKENYEKILNNIKK